MFTLSTHVHHNLQRTIAEMNDDWLATHLFIFTTDMCLDMCSQPEMSGLRDSGIMVPARYIGLMGSTG